jgi:hypothetical protein
MLRREQIHEAERQTAKKRQQRQKQQQKKKKKKKRQQMERTAARACEGAVAIQAASKRDAAGNRAG